MGSVVSTPAQIVTHGNCSPVVTDVNGDVSIVCYATDPDAPKFRISYYHDLAHFGKHLPAPVPEFLDPLVDECRGRFHRNGRFHGQLQLSNLF
jgi:hypothetical protein